MPLVSSFRGNIGPIGNARKYDFNYFGNGSDGDVTYTSNTSLTSSTDGDMIVKQYKSLTINSGVSLTTSSRCKGLVIFVQNNCTIAGNILMDSRGAYVNATNAGVPASGLRFPFKTSSNFYGGANVFSTTNLTDYVNGAGNQILEVLKYFGINSQPIGSMPTLVRQGANGGGNRGRGGGTGLSPTAAGVGQAGGGGGGGATAGGAGAPGGAGSYGSCFGGGSGGGGNGHGDGGVGNATAWGGPGGYGHAYSGDAGHSSGGGAGNPGGGRTRGGNGGTGTGGTVILVVGGTLNITGGIYCRGAGGGSSYYANQGAGGGGAGGGNIIVAYKNLSNLGTLNVNGGGGGYGHNGGNGSSGGSGSIQTFQLI